MLQGVAVVFCVLLALVYIAEGSSRLGKWCSFGNAFVGTGRKFNRDFVDVGNKVALDGAFTIEAWIWATDPLDPTWNTIVSRTGLFWQHQTEMPNVYTDFNFQIDDYGLLSFFMGNGIIAPFQYGILARSAAPVPGQKWVHVAVSVDAIAGANPSEAVIYIDGQEVGRDAWSEGTRQYSADNAIRIGRYDNTDADVQYWDGKIDELRIWNSVRTQQQILDNMFLSLNDAGNAGLVVYYKFDTDPADKKADRNLVQDQSPAGNNGWIGADGPLAPVYCEKSAICV